MAFNPASLDTRAASDEGVWFTITDLNGKEIHEDGEPVQLRIAGRDSAVVKEAITNPGDGAEQAEKVATIIKGWSKNLQAESALELAAIPHIAEFVVKKALARVNFTMKSPKS